MCEGYWHGMYFLFMRLKKYIVYQEKKTQENCEQIKGTNIFQPLTVAHGLIKFDHDLS